MANLPKFYRSSAGVRYFVVNGRKVFIEPGVSKKQILSIYKTLKKTIKTKKRKQTKQSAQTVININNEPKRRNRSNRNRKYVKFGSTINPLHQSRFHLDLQKIVVILIWLTSQSTNSIKN